jgi:hypothetical protein
MEWQPISTHVQHSTNSVILWDGERVSTGWFCKGLHGARDEWLCDQEGEGVEGMHPQPTHWMPLPPPLAHIGSRVWTMDDICADCGKPNPNMHNSREVRGGFLWLKVKRERFPGFLCQSCWKRANPVLFPPHQIALTR